MKAVTSFITKRVFACPDCGSLEHECGHLDPGASFGPWYCDECGCSVRGSVDPDGSVNIERHTERMANTLVLLRLDAPGTADNPIHIVVKGMVFYPDGGQPVLDDKSDERDSYYYDVHTCPWNYLRLPIKEGDNTDPHGLFVHQETILMPKGYEGRIEVKDKDGDYDSIDAWRKLFTSLR